MAKKQATAGYTANRLQKERESPGILTSQPWDGRCMRKRRACILNHSFQNLCFNIERMFEITTRKNKMFSQGEITTDVNAEKRKISKSLT